MIIAVHYPNSQHHSKIRIYWYHSKQNTLKTENHKEFSIFITFSSLVRSSNFCGCKRTTICIDCWKFTVEFITFRKNKRQWSIKRINIFVRNSVIESGNLWSFVWNCGILFISLPLCLLQCEVHQPRYNSCTNDVIRVS